MPSSPDLLSAARPVGAAVPSGRAAKPARSHYEGVLEYSSGASTLAFFLLSPEGVKVIDDPLDPVFVTVGPSLGRVELQIGEGPDARYSRLLPGDARRVAKALLQAAEDIEGKPRPR